MKVLTLLLTTLFITSALAKEDKYESITTSDGKTYTNVTISSVTPSGIRFIHEAGVKTIEFAHLSKEIQEKYGYNPVESNKHKEQQVALALKNEAIRLASVKAARLANIEAEKKMQEAMALAASNRQKQQQGFYDNSINWNQGGNSQFRNSYRQDYFESGDSNILTYSTPRVYYTGYNRTYPYNGYSGYTSPQRIYLNSNPVYPCDGYNGGYHTTVTHTILAHIHIRAAELTLHLQKGITKESKQSKLAKQFVFNSELKKSNL
jgi:hypothetical protein